MNVFKFAIPLAAIFCFGALAPLTDAATSKRSSSESKKSNSSSARKKSSSTKKSSKSSKSSSAKKKSSKTTSKSKGKSERRTAKAPAPEPNEWIDELPEVELPEASGPAEDELLEPVSENPEP